MKSHAVAANSLMMSEDQDQDDDDDDDKEHRFDQPCLELLTEKDEAMSPSK